jgi:hypothetical protein
MHVSPCCVRLIGLAPAAANADRLMAVFYQARNQVSADVTGPAYYDYTHT